MRRIAKSEATNIASVAAIVSHFARSAQVRKPLRGQKFTVVSTSCTAQIRFSAASCSADANSASSTQCASWNVTAITRLVSIVKLT